MNKDTIEQICSFLRGHKLPMRSDDPRQWADEIERDLVPMLDELAKLKAKKAPKGEPVSA